MPWHRGHMEPSVSMGQAVIGPISAASALRVQTGLEDLSKEVKSS